MMSEETQPVTADRERDNLEIIVDIGPKYAAALTNIGICSFSELAKHTPESLSQELKDNTSVRISTERIDINNWIGQAKDMVSEENPGMTSSRQNDPGDAAIESLNRQQADQENSSWQEYASFIITFERSVAEGEGSEWRTKVYKTENGPPEKPFPGLATAPWIDWMFKIGKLPSAEPENSKNLIVMGQPDANKAESIQIENTEGEEMSTNSSESSHRDEITIKRGDHIVTYKKSPDLFAVRVTTGNVTSETSLESALGRPKSEIRHVGSIAPENMDLFSVENSSELEETMDELRKTSAADVISHVYQLDNTPGGELTPTGTMTIQYQPDASKEDREAVLDEFGLQVVDGLYYMPDGYTIRLTAASKYNPLKIAEALQGRENIIRVAEPDMTFRVELHYVPTDSKYPEQWHLNNRGDDLGLLAGADVKAEAAWERTRGSRDIRICIIDDGFDLEHPEFNAPGKIIAPRDFGQDDFDPNPVFENDNHGTCCAGVALAEENVTGVVGLAPECAFMPVRFSPIISDNVVEDYFLYAAEHSADVISCSWSAAKLNFPLPARINSILHWAATEGRDGKGCVILFASGNTNPNGRPLDGILSGKISHQGFALHPDVIAVAASNSRDQRSHYSNYGDEIAVCAPSSGAGGRGIVTTDRRGIKGYTTEDYSSNFGGTSSSTPLVAGLAALLLAIKEDLTAVEVKKIIMDTADKIGDQDDYVDGHSEYYGHGRINAQRAVEHVLKLRDDETPSDEEEKPGDGKPEDQIPDDKSAEDIDIQIISIAEPVELSGGLVSRLKTELIFEVSGDGREAFTVSQPAYRVELYLFNSNTKEKRFISSDYNGRFQPQQFEYTSELEFIKPGSGSYEFSSNVIFAHPAGENVVTRRGPTFNIS